MSTTKKRQLAEIEREVSGALDRIVAMAPLTAGKNSFFVRKGEKEKLKFYYSPAFLARLNSARSS